MTDIEDVSLDFRGIPSLSTERSILLLRKNAAIGLLLLSLAIGLPFVVQTFFIFQATMILVYAIAIIGLNLLTGFSGQLSLGHAAFYAVGAYTAAILIESFGVPYFLTVPAAAVVCFVFGFAFGLPALRLEGIYLALATFALSVATPQLLKFSLFENWTGGVQGLVIDKPVPPAPLPISADQWLYFFTLAITVVFYLVARNLTKTRTGRALLAIRDNPLAAGSMGINKSMYKALTFGVSALYTGVAGALGAIVVQFVAPDSFTIYMSIALLVGLVVGGVGWLPGAFFGAAFILLVPNLAENVSKGLSGATYGFILIVLMLVMPRGCASLLGVSSKLKSFLITKRNRQDRRPKRGDLHLRETF
jgi:branched-chain amino acid transport system permease protein